MTKYDVSPEYRPISAWGYIGYTLLFCIPIVGLVLLVVFSLSSTNYNRRNYARSYLCALLVCVVLIVGAIAARSLNPDVGRAVTNIFQNVTKLPTLSLNSKAQAGGLLDGLFQLNTNNTKKTTDSKSPAKATEKPKVYPKGVTPSFAEQMDAYEAFFDEYIAFMTSFNSDSANGLTMMMDYLDMLSRSSEYMEAIDAIDESKLSKADRAYFLEVTIRIDKKLLDVVGALAN